LVGLVPFGLYVRGCSLFGLRGLRSPYLWLVLRSTFGWLVCRSAVRVVGWFSFRYVPIGLLGPRIFMVRFVLHAYGFMFRLVLLLVTFSRSFSSIRSFVVPLFGVVVVQVVMFGYLRSVTLFTFTFTLLRLRSFVRLRLLLYALFSFVAVTFVVYRTFVIRVRSFTFFVYVLCVHTFRSHSLFYYALFDSRLRLPFSVVVVLGSFALPFAFVGCVPRSLRLLRSFLVLRLPCLIGCCLVAFGLFPFVTVCRLFALLRFTRCSFTLFTFGRSVWFVHLRLRSLRFCV